MLHDTSHTCRLRYIIIITLHHTGVHQIRLHSITLQYAVRVYRIQMHLLRQNIRGRLFAMRESDHTKIAECHLRLIRSLFKGRIQ